MRALAHFAELPGEVERLLLSGEAQRVGVMLIDAFGWAFVERHREHPLLRRCARDGLLAPMAAQFPSTTTAHVTTLHSGLPVGEHGLYEWRVFEPSAGRTIIPLKGTWADERPDSDPAQQTVDAARYLPASTFYDRLARAGIDSVAIEPASFAPSAYDDVALRGARVQTHGGLEDAASRLAAALAAPGDVPRYVFAYADEVDSFGHDYGPSSPEFAATCQTVLDGLEAGLFGPGAPAFVPGTVLLLTADHGQVDVHPHRTDHVDLLWPKLAAFVRRGSGGRPVTVAGSARDLFLHIEPEHVDHVVEELQQRLARRATVHATAELVAAGWFGPDVGPRLLDRLAEVCVLPADGRMAWWSGQGGGAGRFLGHHGGRTQQESQTFIGALRLA